MLTLRRPRLRTILLLVNLLVLALPLGGIGVLRLYESALIRQTETELIAQGAVIAAAWRAALLRVAPAGDLSAMGHPVDPRWRRDESVQWHPRAATLDLANAVVRPLEPTALPAAAADPLAALAGAQLTEVLRDAQRITLAGMRIVDANGVIVASTGDDAGLSMHNREEVRRALRGEPVSLLRARQLEGPEPALGSISRGSRLRAAVMTPIVHDARVLGAVVMTRTPRHIRQALYGKRKELALAAFGLLCAVALLALLTSFAISRPVLGLIVQARRASAGERGAMVPLSRPVTREVEHLSMRLAEMARTLEERAEYIRSFAQHVSHEFKTPLTAISGTVELLDEHAASMSDTERKRFLDNLRDDTARLSTLVGRLLQLARADTASPGEGDRSSLATALAAVQQRFDGADFAVEIDGPVAGDAEVSMAPETLESILGSLVDNARQHGASSIRIACRSDRARHTLTLTDDGPGISQSNASRIFEPFFTTARDEGGTGLGLTVVRSLLSAHHGSIELETSQPGTQFRLTLPVAVEV